ncbi:MAG: DUF4251 domain-containing protein [Dysgonomonas sp.]
MKTIITTATLIVTLLLTGCKSGESISKQENIAQITKKIESGDYKFIPQKAIPMGASPVNLSYTFSLKVSKDSIDSYLPYYGRAYIAPSPTDGGIKFVSTDFNYTISEKKKGMWDISIIPNDNQKRYRLSLNVGETGYGTLTVQDTNRQSISFYGVIE